MDTITLSKPLALDNRGSCIASLVPFHKAQYDGLNRDDLIKAFVRNMSFAMVTDNHDEYNKHLMHMFVTFLHDVPIRNEISLKVSEKTDYLRSINK